jgi:hypothetical protein
VNGSEPEVGALRLRAIMPVLAAVDGFPDEHAEPRSYFGPVTEAIFKSCTPEDIELARACLDVERDLRRRQEWAALEFLLGAIPPGEGLDSIYELPPGEQIAALLAASRCGWLGGI